MYHEKPTLPDIKLTGYPDFFAPDNAPLDLAAVVAGMPPCVLAVYPIFRLAQSMYKAIHSLNSPAADSVGGV